MFTSFIRDAEPIEIVQMTLVHAIEGSSVHNHVIRDVRAKRAQLQYFNMVTVLENWSHLEVQGTIGLL